MSKDANDDKVHSVTEVFKTLGAKAQSRPCCTSWGPGHVDCFIRGPKSNVLHISIDKGVYSDWEDLGGIIVDEIECISRDIGIIDVLVLGTNTGLYIKTFSDGKWSGWVSKGGQLMEVPSCAVRTPSIIDCMLRGSANQGYHIGTVDGEWGTYKDLGGSLFSPIGCSSRTETMLNCFVSGMDLHLNQIYKSQESEWHDYADLGCLVKGRPSVTTWDRYRMDVFTLGVETNSVMHKIYNDDGKWQKDWVDLGGVFDSAPDCVTTGVGKIHCFAVGEESYLYRNAFDGMKWSSWKRSFGFFLETPSCVVSNENEVTCAIRRFNKEVVLLTYRF